MSFESYEQSGLLLVEHLNGTYGDDAMICMIICICRQWKTSFQCYDQLGIPIVDILKATYGHDPMNCMILCVYSKGKKIV